VTSGPDSRVWHVKATPGVSLQCPTVSSILLHMQRMIM
jgi:hypothetical protein